MASRLNGDTTSNHSFGTCGGCRKLSSRANIYPCCVCCRRVCGKCRTKSMVMAHDEERNSHRFVGRICDPCLERHGAVRDTDPEERLVTFEPLGIKDGARPLERPESFPPGATVAAIDKNRLAEECVDCRKVLLSRNMSPGRFCPTCSRHQWICHSCKGESLTPELHHGECSKCSRRRAAAASAGRPFQVWRLRSLKIKEMASLYTMQEDSAPSTITCAELGIGFDDAENGSVRGDRKTEGWKLGLTRSMKRGLACAGIAVSFGVAVWLASGQRPSRREVLAGLRRDRLIR